MVIQEGFYVKYNLRSRINELRVHGDDKRVQIQAPRLSLSLSLNISVAGCCLSLWKNDISHTALYAGEGAAGGVGTKIR